MSMCPSPAAPAPEHMRVRRGAATIVGRADGAGPPILLIPSLGRGAEDFDDLTTRLTASGLRVVRAEPRGIGGSEGSLEGLDLFALGDDALAILDAAEGADARFVVAGHAFGNWVARALAAKHPSRVRGVALLAASLGTSMNQAIRPSINGSFDPALPSDERLAHLRRAYFAPGNDASVWLGGWHHEAARAQRAATVATTDRSWQRVAERLPTLYVAALADAIAPPPSLDQLRTELGPLVRLAEVEGAGHALLPEQPEATAAALVDFVEGLPP